MANLHETSFSEAWNSIPFQELRKAHLRKDVSGTVCEKCVAYQHAQNAHETERLANIQIQLPLKQE